MHEWIYDCTAIFVVLLGLCFLFQKKIRNSEVWYATVTPLASIIGSGFLVSAPLLLFTTGPWAFFVMLAIVVVAYGIGSSIRFNIQYVEPLLKHKDKTYSIKLLDGISRPALGIAYLISVTFYLKLLSAFALRGFGITEEFWMNMITTIILLFIGITGKFRGLSMLELLETYSVNIKLAIILALIVTFSMYNVEQILHWQWQLASSPHESLWGGFCKVLGMLIIVQGFETSRYIGEGHSQALRIQTMKYAQWISGGIYLVFVAISTSIFHNITHIKETAVIDLSETVASFLPYLLIFASIMSQFSAAVSDTLGGGGLFSETFNKKISSNLCYLLIALASIGLTWLTNIYEIITFASQAFAFYYALQILMSLILVYKQKSQHTYRWAKLMLFSNLFGLMILILVLGTPIQA